ncbi:hypothetical protein LCGC14_2987230 [marine sediment metagenome]|uniref:Uncharacterized protein n=1 Tax=marine sediment metagenome TaxID=412755 RepID=A0A0F8X5S0_9ZZZZ
MLILPFHPETASATITIDGVPYRVPLVDSDGHLQVDVLSNALPTGAATETNQATMITALQLIDDLRAALGSVAGDQLRMEPGWDSLNRETYAASVGNHITTARWTYTVPASTFAIVTHVHGYVSASTAVSDLRSLVRILDSGGGPLAHIMDINSVTGQILTETIPCAVLLDAGEKLEGSTSNAGVTSKVIGVHASITEISK